MTMHDQAHPDDERLAALAGHDPEALADAALEAHVRGCDRCRGLVDDLAMLRSALSELPDVAPSRPLQLVPPVPPAGRTSWVRRLVAPALAVGSGLVLVGAVGLAGVGPVATPSAERLADGQAGPSERSLWDAIFGGLSAEAAGSDDAAQEPPVEEGAPTTAGARDLASPQAVSGAAGSLAPLPESGGPDARSSSDATPSATPGAQPAEPTTGGAQREAGGAGPNLALISILAGLAMIGGTLTLRYVLAPRRG